MRYVLPALLASALLLSGCYQAQMTTGKRPSNTVVQENWAPSFLYGLVPAEVDVSDECTNGIASAERQFRFVNMLVSALTLNIYTPQTVTVTCAAGGGMAATQPDSDSLKYSVSIHETRAEVQEVLGAAALHSSLSNQPLQIQVVDH